MHFKKGHTPWNKGLTKKDPRVAKYALKLIGNKPSLETREKLSKKLSGKNHPNYGKHLSPELRKKLSEIAKGRIISPEQRKKISLTLKSKPLSEETKRKMLGRIPWNKNKKGEYKMTFETRVKMKASSHKGEKHHNWKGGVSSENERIRKSMEYTLWREAVFARDNYTCQICNIPRGWNKKLGKTIKIEADHIKPFSLFPELRFAIDNGRTLCKECHRKTETWGGDSKYKIGHAPTYRPSKRIN